jgi:hypothetical protein
VAGLATLTPLSYPPSVTHCPGDEAIRRIMIQAWRRDGILQFTMTPH